MTKTRPWQRTQKRLIRSELGRPSGKSASLFKISPLTKISEQSKTIAAQYRKGRALVGSKLTNIKLNLAYGPETKKAEESFRELGELLGLQSDRPDKSKGKGPDIRWRASDSKAVIGFELKTDKLATSEYAKKEIGQSLNHENWLHENHGTDAVLNIVGRFLPVSAAASPSPTMRIIELDSTLDLYARTKTLYDQIDAGDKSDLDSLIQNWLDHLGLNWPDCINSLDSRLVVDLNSER